MVKNTAVFSLLTAVFPKPRYFLKRGCSIRPKFTADLCYICGKFVWLLSENQKYREIMIAQDPSGSSNSKSKIVPKSAKLVKEPKVSISDAERAVWTDDLEKVLLFVLREECARGSFVEGGFKSKVWSAMTKEFNRRASKSWNNQQIRGKYRELRTKFDEVSKMRRDNSGFGWNEADQLLTASHTVWKDYIAAHPKAAYWKTHPLLNYDILCEIFLGTLATGQYSVSSAANYNKAQVAHDLAEYSEDDSSSCSDDDTVPDKEKTAEVESPSVSEAEELQSPKKHKAPRDALQQQPTKKSQFVRGPRLTESGKQKAETNRMLGELVAMHSKARNMKPDFVLAGELFVKLYAMDDLYTPDETSIVKEHFCDHPTKATMFLAFSEDERDAYVGRLMNKIADGVV